MEISSTTSTRKRGDIGEDAAANHLLALGFTIIERNFYTRYGEIDIIASLEGVYHFIEVKSSFRTFDPIFNLSFAKLAKIKKAVLVFVDLHHIEDYCISAVLIRGKIGALEVEFLPNITAFT